MVENPDSKNIHWTLHESAIWIEFRQDGIVDDLSRGSRLAAYRMYKDSSPEPHWKDYVSVQEHPARVLKAALAKGEITAYWPVGGSDQYRPIPAESWGDRNDPEFEQSVRFRITDVKEMWPVKRDKAKAKNSGATALFDWPSCWREIDRAFEENGELSDDDFEWSRPSHVKKKIEEYFMRTAGRCPVPSTIYANLRKYLENRNYSE